jgi:hypothetical protein
LFVAFFGMMYGASVEAVYNVAVNLIDRGLILPDGPEADYRDLADPPG